MTWRWKEMGPLRRATAVLLASSACHSVSPSESDTNANASEGAPTDASALSTTTTPTFSNKVPPAPTFASNSGAPWATELPSLQYKPEVMVDLSDGSLAYSPELPSSRRILTHGARREMVTRVTGMLTPHAVRGWK